MQYVALDAITLVPGQGEPGLVARPEIDPGGEESPRSCVLHSCFYPGREAGDTGSACLAPPDDWAGEEDVVGLTGWKRFMAWTAAAVASWGLVFGCVAIARALFS